MKEAQVENKVILTASEPITCPKCNHHFPLDEGITRQTIERYENEFLAAFAAERRAMEETLVKEAERKATKLFTEQIAKLQEQLSDSRKGEREAKALITQAQADAKAKALAEFAEERKSIVEALNSSEEKLKQFREQEVDLRKQKKALEERQEGLELELMRKLDDEKKKLAEAIARKEADRFALIEAEYKKKIEDAQRANDDLRRKLEQGSQQLQGEVLELELEHLLATNFLHDQIEEVKKGQRGADVIQTVRTPLGQACGRIIWEAKRAEHWSDKWLQKLKDDQQEAKADLAVLVTTAMPKGVSDSFTRVGDVWVVAPQLMRPVAETLRVILLEAHRLKLVNTGRNEKMESLYNYLSSPPFAQKVRTMLEAFESMRSDLEAEKRAMQRIWAKRQTQIERVTGSMVTVVGELQAIAQDSLPQLDSLDVLALPADEAAADI